MTTLEPNRSQIEPASRGAGVLKKLGVAGFLFFLIKGLLWLLVPAALVGWNAL